MLFSSRNYAIGMAHYQMARGHKGLLFVMGAYLAVAGTIIGLTIYNTDPRSLPVVLLGIATLFLVLEGMGLIVLGAVRIAGCIRIDLVSNMIESHRQMPISAARAMLGYLFGSTVHIVAVTVLNIGVLAALQASSGINMDSFVLSQIVLAIFALFVWTFSAMGSLMMRQAMPIMVLVFMFSGIGSAIFHGWGLLPGVSLLATPFLGETVFNLARGLVNFHPAYPVALTAQAAFATLFFIGACRRYRGAYLTTFNVPMGLALVMVWGVLSALAIRLWPSVVATLGRAFRNSDQPEVGAQIVASLCVAVLLMIVPAFALATWETRHRVPMARRLLVLAAITLAGAISMLADGFHAGPWIVTLLVLAAHVVTIYAAFRFCAGFAPMSTAILTAVLLLGLWLTPLLIEVVRWYFLPENRNDFVVHDLSLISTFSPLGTLLSAWSQDPNGPALWAGLVFQLGIAGLVWRLAARRHKVKKSTPMPKPLAEQNAI